MAREPEGDKGSDAGPHDVHRSLSHNLRTPLAVIKGCTDMLLTHSDTELDAQHRRELLMVMSENVDALADAISWVEERFADVADVAEDPEIRVPNRGAESTESCETRGHLL